MFLPVKADFALPRFPILTVLICLICFGVFIKQQSDWKEFGLAIDRFCNASRSHIEQIVFERIAESQNMDACGDIMYTIANDPTREESEVIAEMASKIRPLTGFNSEDSREYVQQMLEEQTRRFNTLVPQDPDEGLAYYTGSWNPITMITSSFAHGDWGHILFNLVFFFAFAATVEVLIGPLRYVAFVLVDSWFIGLTGSIAAAATAQHYWTLGLSGVVMGMMGLFAYLLPRGKIKCYYFFIIIFGSVAIPGWMLTAWYLGGDIVTLFTNDDYGRVNVLAHVMGGVGGYLFGLLFLREVRKDAEHAQDALERLDFEKRFR
ncbi:MAG: rhomboid family intramembrane serine protease [Gammaproteobacteria bacterium]|jgi:membrane associated rhomboid family serine protease|nr:rhomboid family intramembrane serine protease [Gammaproteobacteria bacterium]